MQRAKCLFLAVILLSLILCPVINTSAASTYFTSTVGGVLYTCYYVGDSSSGKVELFASQKNQVTTHIDVPSQVTNSGKTYQVTGLANGAFAEWTQLPSVTIPSSVTSLGQKAFWRCGKLTAVNIQGNVTKFGDFCFNSCSSLKSISIPASVTSLDTQAAFAVSGFESLTFPGSIKALPKSTCSSCASLKTVVLKEGVTDIGTTAFKDCKVLSTITIPSTVKSISDDAFQNCTGISTVYIPASNTYAINWFKEHGYAAAIKTPDSGTGNTGSDTEKATLSKLKSVKLKALSAKKLQISWKKLSKKEQGKIQKIEIQYSTDKSFKTGVKTKYAKKTKSSYTIKGLKKNTKYYVRIRAYKKSGGVVYVSKWVTKNKKTKKK